MAVEEFVRTVRVNDIAGLTRMPGVGRKTAERLIVEMKDRLEEWGDDLVVPDYSGSLVDQPPSERQLSQEAEAALVALGYKPAEATRIIAKAIKADPSLSSSDELIRQALRSMAQS
jgi:Holliday junction DNA helicase RuvA